MLAALFVAAGGCYFGLDGVDPWPEERDARLYAGPWPVVAHPPLKQTWLYAVGVALPSLPWGAASAPARFGVGLHDGWTKTGERRSTRTGEVQRLSRGQRIATPHAFRDLLLSIASTSDNAQRDPHGECKTGKVVNCKLASPLQERRAAAGDEVSPAPGRPSSGPERRDVADDVES